jgi:hypothetical protein
MNNDDYGHLESPLTLEKKDSRRVQWQLARKPIPFPVRRQYDALASPHRLLFREIRNESFPAQQARDTLEVRSGSSLTFRASAAHFRSFPESQHSLAQQYLSVWANNGLSRCKKVWEI